MSDNLWLALALLTMLLLAIRQCNKILKIIRDHQNKPCKP
jgi:hypothetical protein